MGEILMEGLSDAGSIPARTTKNTAYAVFFSIKQWFLEGESIVFILLNYMKEGKDYE